MLKCPHCNKVIPMALFTTFIGKIGGSKTSEAKKRSSKLNGLKGGRPKQKGKRPNVVIERYVQQAIHKVTVELSQKQNRQA